MRIMVDTNVLISFGMFRSSRMRQVFEIAWGIGNTLLIPDFVADEARGVILRKWPSRVDELDVLLARIRHERVRTPDSVDVEIAIRDPHDLPILRAAIAGRADVLVTGDLDFADALTGGVLVRTPADFVSEHLSGRL